MDEQPELKFVPKKGGFSKEMMHSFIQENRVLAGAVGEMIMFLNAIPPVALAIENHVHAREIPDAKSQEILRQITMNAITRLAECGAQMHTYLMVLLYLANNEVLPAKPNHRLDPSDN